MGEALEVHGFVLSSMPIGEADRRVVLLTKEMGRISAFARGARKPTNQFVSATRAFSFGKFVLYQGRSTYTLQSAEISDYFEALVADVEATAYGCYFCELSAYFTRENMDGKNALNLLYMAFRALEKKRIPYPLIRRIFELRSLVFYGEYPDFFRCKTCGKELKEGYFSLFNMSVECPHCHVGQGGTYLSEGVLYTLQFILSEPLNHLFSFTVNPEIMEVLEEVVEQIMRKIVEKPMKSLEVLAVLT